MAEMSFGNMSGGFMFLGIGLALAAAIACIEVVVSKKMMKR
jgi:hypothetical protein